MKLKEAVTLAFLGLSAMTIHDNIISREVLRPAVYSASREAVISARSSKELAGKIEEAGIDAAKGRYMDSYRNLQYAFPFYEDKANPDIDSLEALAEKVIMRYKAEEKCKDQLRSLANSLRNERAKYLLSDSLQKAVMNGSKKKEVYLAFNYALSQFRTVELAKEKTLLECTEEPKYEEGIYFFTKENAEAALQEIENLAVQAVLIDMQQKLIEKDLSRFL